MSSSMHSSRRRRLISQGRNLTAVLLVLIGSTWVALEPIIRTSNPGLGWVHGVLTFAGLGFGLIRFRWGMTIGGLMGGMAYIGLLSLFAISLGVGEISSRYTSSNYWMAICALGLTALGHFLLFVQGLREPRAKVEEIIHTAVEGPWASRLESGTPSEQEAPPLIRNDQA